MAAGIIKKKKKITSKIYTVKIGTSLYNGWYYGNIDMITSDPNIIGIIVWDVTGTHPTLIQKGMSSEFLRVYCKQSGATVTIKVIYYS